MSSTLQRLAYPRSFTLHIIDAGATAYKDACEVSFVHFMRHIPTTDDRAFAREMFNGTGRGSTDLPDAEVMRLFVALADDFPDISFALEAGTVGESEARCTFVKGAFVKMETRQWVEQQAVFPQENFKLSCD